MMRQPGLLIGCAAGALLAAQAAPAAAQSFQGTPTVVTGSATVTTGPTTTNIFLNTSETVINWTTEDVAASGAIDFQPVGTIATFENGPSGTDYTVLNRILPVDGGGLPVSATVSFNGTVNSLIVNDIGGHIWFYSPTGIIAGPTARFNVGSLILTTNDIGFIPNPVGGFGSIYGPGGLVQFTGPAGSTGFVEVQPGAVLDASGVNAYVALVAPRVIQGGQVQADGQIAYIAAEQLDMTINGGLFDFVLTVGTEDANGVVHTGTTTGPASTSAADSQRIAMVALPKNDALTMLLSGSIGYSPAASAANEGSSVVLAAGFDSAAPLADPGNRLGSISIGNATFGNALTAYASDDIAITPVGGTTTFEDVATFHALDDLGVIAGSGERVEALADLILNAGEPGTGGDILVEAQGTGVIDVARQFAASASGSAFFGTAPGDAQGGTVTITADGGTIDALEAFIDASAAAGSGGALGGTATGGTIDLAAANGGAMTFTNFVSANAGASGGGSPATGGDATGGTVNVAVTNGTITTGSFSASVDGIGGGGTTSGGDGFGGAISLIESDGQLALGFVSLSANGVGSFSDGQGGSGTSGQIAIALNDQAQSWDELTARAVATAGSGTASSGRATGLADAISLMLTGPSSLTIAGSMVLDADARVTSNTALGVNSRAGGVAVTVDEGAALAVGDTLEAHANILYGVEGPPPSSTTTPDVEGGTVSIVARGTLGAAGLTATANAIGASADTRAGTATGGTVSVTAADGGSIAIDDGAGGGDLTLLANASGMTGPEPAHAQGGTAQLIADGGSITALGAATVEANAEMRLVFTPDGPGFDATGGIASVELLQSAAGTSAIAVGSLDVRAVGDARPMQFDFILGTDVPVPVVGDGGTGRGGAAAVTQEAGTLTAGSLTLDAAGFGAFSAASTGPAAFESGDGFGGSATFSALGGTSTVATLAILARGAGGGGAPSAVAAELAALAGGGSGGTAELLVSDGVLDAPTIQIEAPGLGADGMSHTGSGNGTDGGFGNGGNALFTMPGGSSGSFTTTALDLNGEGHGGTGGTSAGGIGGSGGQASGGTALAALADGAFALGAFRALADGYGGDGVAGGEGRGGSAGFALVDTAGPAGTRSVDGFGFYASGVGGIGNGGAIAPSDAGAVTIAVEVANPGAALAVDGALEALSRGSNGAPGTGFSLTISGAPLTIGGNAGIDTARDAVIAAGSPLDVDGSFTLFARSLTETGQVSSSGPLGISAPGFITAERLSSGAATTLLAANGSLTVSADLASVGDVLVQARSVDLRSLGGLGFSLAQATAGDLAIATVGNLTLPIASATGTMTLSSSAGAIVSATGLNSGGAFTASGATGLDLATLASGDTTTLSSPGGAVVVDGLVSTGTVTASGRSVDLTSPGELTFADLQATDGGIAVSTGGTLTIAQAGASGAIDLTAASGSVVGTGPIVAGGPVRVIGPAGIDMASLSAGGTTVLQATGGDIEIDSLGSVGLVTASGDAIDIVSPGALTFAAADALNTLSVVAVGDLAFASVSAGLDLSLESTGGSLTATGDVTGQFGLFAAEDDIRFDGNLDSGGSLGVTAGGSFTVAGDTTTGDAQIDADGGITMASLDSGASTRLEAANGGILIADLRTAGSVTALGLDVDIASSGGLQFDEAIAFTGDVRIVTGDDLSASVVNADGAVDLDVGGTFTLLGEARGNTIMVTSSDIAIEDGATLGLQGNTSQITLVNRDAGIATFVGGDAQGGSYSLDRDEIARLSSDVAINILADFNIIVGDFALAFGPGGNIGSGGTLHISTPEVVSVVGDVAIATTGADDTFEIDPRLVAVDTTSGSIALEGGNGAPLGRLAITGDTVAVATTDTLGLLIEISDFAEINALLDEPGGNPEPLRAGTIAIDVTDALYIQNTGASDAYDDRLGFAAGALEIVTESADTRIAINGQILTAGGPVGGLDTEPLVTINGAPAAAGGQFDPGSTINGCVIGGDCRVVPPPPPEERPGEPPPRDDLDPLPDPSPPAMFAGPLIELAESDPLVEPPLVDEPITGIGNDDLWEPRCEADDDDCPATEGQP